MLRKQTYRIVTRFWIHPWQLTSHLRGALVSRKLNYLSLCLLFHQLSISVFTIYQYPFFPIVFFLVSALQLVFFFIINCRFSFYFYFFFCFRFLLNLFPPSPSSINPVLLFPYLCHYYFSFLPLPHYYLLFFLPFLPIATISFFSPILPVITNSSS